MPSTRENQTRPGAASTCRGEAIAAKSTHNHQYEDKTHGLPFPNSHSLWRDSQYLAVGQRHRNRKIPATEEIPRGHDHRHVLKLPGQGWPNFRRYSLDHRTRTGDTRIWSLAPSRRREGRRPRGLSWSNGLWPATDLRVRVYQSRCLLPGSREVLLLPRPLRTGRESFPSSSSSLHERPSQDAVAFVRPSRTWICR